MKFFVDTTDLDEIREANAMGVLDGVTTNPSLMKKAGDVNFHEHIYEICEIVEGGDVSAEVTTTEHEAIMEEARVLAKIHKNVVVKIPFIEEGVKALKSCDDEGIRTNCTLCFSAAQALIAAKAGADYISPFIGRIDDIGHRGMTVIEQIRTIYDNYDFETEILAASIRHPAHVREAAMAGADVATVPPAVLKKLLGHPLTDRGLERFMSDWADYEDARSGEEAAAAAAV